MTSAIGHPVGNYLELFSEFEKSAPGRGISWLDSLRREAFARFCEVGFPTTRVEDWRFTDVSVVSRTAFHAAPAKHSLTARELGEIAQPTGAASTLVFVNGYFAPELSSTGTLPRGVKVRALSQQLAEDPSVLQSHLGRYLDTRRDPFCALNTAFLRDGSYVHVSKGVVADAPIYILYISTDAKGPGPEGPMNGAAGPMKLMSHARNLIVVEPEGKVTVVEDHVSLGEDNSFCTSGTEIVAGDNSNVEHYMIERLRTSAYYFSTVRVQQGRNANVASHSVLLGGALARNNVNPVLAGEGGECLINGLFLGSGRQHLDNHMRVEHASPHCSSRQFYNGILDGHAHGVFHGRIIVQRIAQKTDAKQTNRNLLLSDDAQIDTKPQLEIFADDVKCTHGATIGQIEESALFYLRSRGIEEVAARHLLLSAFAAECLDRMSEGPARVQVQELIRQAVLRMAGSVAKAAALRAADEISRAEVAKV